MPKYRINRPIRWDGEKIPTGEIELSKKDAKPYLVVNAISEIVADDSSDTGDSKADTDDKELNMLSREEMIRDAINSLDSSDDSKDFTKSGKPDVNAINDAAKLLEPVSSPERDAIWEAMQSADAE